MGKKLLVFLILVAILFVGYTKYTRMVTLEKGLIAQWSLIESQYRHKSDVIFELSKNINDIIDEELLIANEVRKARNLAAQIKLDPDDISLEKLTEFNEANELLIEMQEELMEITKQYTHVADNQTYRELITELDGTEIRIANGKRRLNEQVNMYNKYINGFFNLAIAQVLGFHEWPVFAPLLGE